MINYLADAGVRWYSAPDITSSMIEQNLANVTWIKFNVTWYDSESINVKLKYSLLEMNRISLHNRTKVYTKIRCNVITEEKV